MEIITKRQYVHKTKQNNTTGTEHDVTMLTNTISCL